MHYNNHKMKAWSVICSIYVGDLPPEVESEAWSSERYYSIYFNLTTKYSDILGSFQTSAENSSNEPQAQQLSTDGESLESGHSQEYLPVSGGSQPFITTLTVTPSKTVSIITGKLRLYKIGTPENANNVSGNHCAKDIYLQICRQSLFKKKPKKIRLMFCKFKGCHVSSSSLLL